MSRSKKKSNQHSIVNKKASELAFKTRLTGPIGELSVLRQSLLFAEAAMISYLAEDERNIAAGKLGFSDGKVFEFDSSEVNWFQNEHDSIVVFRGRELENPVQLDASIDTLHVLADTVGYLHAGFKLEADEIWPAIEEALESDTKSLWFCGHSIGGALANICAGRCMVSPIQTEPEAMFSFGSPRIGCGRYVHHVHLQHYRWVNNNDIVTRKPSLLASYRHSGTEMYLDRYGNLVDSNGWIRFRDRMLGVLSKACYWKNDSLDDHSVLQYLDRIFDVVRAEESGQ